jgi:carboxyl-terminal processing protease
MGKTMKLHLAVLLAGVFILGLAAGAWRGTIVKSAEGRESYDYLRTYAEALDVVRKNYVDDVKDKDLIYASIKGVMESLDPHSSFLTADMFREMEAETKGEFSGIGIEIDMVDGFLTVVTTMEEAPAFKAGVRPWDRIVKIDGRATGNMRPDDVVNLIRGRKGTRVTLSITRGGFASPMEFEIVRDIIKVESVKFRMLDDDYGYIRISEFQERTGEDLETAVKALQKSGGLKGILLDLRDNPGGLLDQAVDVAGRFLSHGLITYTEGGTEDERLRFYAHGKNDYLGPLVVLVNEGSASASEIVAGALQDTRRSVIVGTRTFGKGSVQSIFPLEDGSAVRLTTSRYYTPSGRSIQADGIHPDIVVDNDMERKKGEKPVSIREKDLERRLEGAKDWKSRGKTQDDQRPERDRDANAEEDDFQLIMGLQVLKSWGPVRRE